MSQVVQYIPVLMRLILRFLTSESRAKDGDFGAAKHIANVWDDPQDLGGDESVVPRLGLDRREARSRREPIVGHCR